MSHQWDELSKSLAEESVPRRESLRLLGAALAGVVLSPLGLGTAWARRAADPCKAFCKCKKNAQQKKCLAACRACSGATRRLCGTCAKGYACAELGNDPFNCGACGYACESLPNAITGCVGGECYYTCQQGYDNCNGDPDDGCETNLLSDPNNCGACGFICNAATPYCVQGTCSAISPPLCPGGGTYCNGTCTNISFDTLNCGGCGIRCAGGETCSGGVCQSPW
jgi:hypothetical protein